MSNNKLERCKRNACRNKYIQYNEFSHVEEYLSLMQDIVVKEVHFYTYNEFNVGYQFFYMFNESKVISNGLITDIPEEYHFQLINLGCSDKELDSEKIGVYYKSIIFKKDLFYFYDGDNKLKSDITIKKCIYRLNTSECEFIYEIVFKDPTIFIVMSSGTTISIVEEKFNHKTKEDTLMRGLNQVCGLLSNLVGQSPVKNCIRTLFYANSLVSKVPSFIEVFQIKNGLHLNFEDQKVKQDSESDEEHNNSSEDNMMSGLF